MAKQGFDVPTFSNTSLMGLIAPICEEYLSRPNLRDCAEKAITEYNMENVCMFYSTFSFYMYFLLSITFLNLLLIYMPRVQTLSF